ncbi:unnamed protein product [Alopecurus aequalis]
MFHLRRCIVARILSSPSASPISPLYCLLSAAAPAVSPNPSFAAEEYLVETCGLSRAQALKAYTKLTHLKSPSNPDAVLAFLADLGLSGADVAALIAKDRSSSAPALREPLPPSSSGSPASNLLRPVKGSCRENLLLSDLESVVKPNVVLLRECGLGVCDIAKLCILRPWLLTSKQESLQAIVACAEGLGVPRGSRMFRQVLCAVGFQSEETITAKVDNLKKTFSWSDAEVRIAVCKAPMMLMRSRETLQHRSEFLINEVGLEPAYIAHRPVMIMYSLEGRNRPRYYVLKFLKEKGLLHKDRDYYSAFMIGNKVFIEKFICPHKEAAPHLAGDYAAACRGEVPT